jgi:hypothetical protein
VRCSIFAVTLTAALFIAGCTPSKTSDGNEERGGSRDCDEPENPYTQGSGHYVGYEWAEKNGAGDCAGSSQSFNEGCEEYETQETEYEECEAKKK